MEQARLADVGLPVRATARNTATWASEKGTFTSGATMTDAATACYFALADTSDNKGGKDGKGPVQEYRRFIRSGDPDQVVTSVDMYDEL
ncbi:MAG: hypothetical protein FRX49_05606 [Trebouxia sp. A1-2]|nr:MAG: hypothetical protein FRX49_05606 [Trebouxia sp. A1-2]